MRVSSAQNSLASGVSINFTISPSNPFLPLKTMLKLTYEYTEHFFRVSSAITLTPETGHHLLECTANEVGGSRKKFYPNFDPRLLIDSKLEVIYDQDIINTISKESSWT